MPNPSGIPSIDTPFVDLKTGKVAPIWYRYLRVSGEAARVFQLIQAPLVDRLAANNYNDGSVLFIDTGTGNMFYVEGAAWVAVT